MDEQKEETKPTGENPDAGSESATDKETKKLNAENERLEKAIEKRQELIAKNKVLMVTKQLSGTAEAGTETKTKFTEEEKASRARIKAVGDASGSAWAKNYE